MTKNNNICFLVFSDDFGEHPSSCQHLFQHISRTYPVLWVNTIGLRTPKLTRRDILKIFIKTKKMFLSFFGKTACYNKSNLSAISHGHGITVCQPFMLPFPNSSMIKFFNKKSVIQHVRKQIKRLQISHPVLVVTAPNACDYIRNFDESRVVYYCVDDFSEWPGLGKKLVGEMVNELIRKSDVFIATSQSLLENLEKHGKKTTLLTHGVDIELFSESLSDEHTLLKTIPKPRVGYFGLFDDRSNQELLYNVASLMPDISFVITGGIEIDISQLQKLENIYFTGSIPYPELPLMAKGYDICMLPYKLNRLTDAIQPLKIKEYLATGKPVVSTSIKESLNLSDHVNLADTADEWEKVIRNNLNGLSSDSLEKRHLFLEHESWNEKSEQFLQSCLE